MRSKAKRLTPWASTLLVACVSLSHCRSESGRRESTAADADKETSAPKSEAAKKTGRDDAIIITFGNGYKPFAWGEGTAVKGVQVDFVKEILQERLGLAVVAEGCPWKRCQRLVRRGKKDGFFTVPTKEREEYTQKSGVPFYETHFLMHVRVDNPLVEDLRRVRSLDDLEHMPRIRHIYMHGSGWHENALKKMKKITTVPDASVIPRMLVLDRADVYIEQDEMFWYQAKEQGVADKLLSIEEPVIRTVGWHLFISKESEHVSIMGKVDKTLEDLKASGELDEIKHELCLKYGIEPLGGKGVE